MKIVVGDSGLIIGTSDARQPSGLGLVSPQDRDRVDPRGAYDGSQRCDQRDGGHRQRWKRQHDSIGRLHPVEQCLYVVRRREAQRKAGDRPHQHHRERAKRNTAGNGGRSRTQGDANADLAPQLQHGIVEQAVEGDTISRSTAT
jgi:hypothetical protein